MAGSEITVLVQLRLFPEYIDRGMRDLLAFARTVRLEEPDCLSLEIAQDLSDPARITMIEKWSDRKAYEDLHLKTPHMQAFIRESGRYFDGVADVHFLRGVLASVDNSRAAPYGR